MSLNKLKARYWWSLPFSRVVAPKEAVCISKCSFALLVLEEFFQAINFHFTRTSEHQPSGNLHSSTKLLAWRLWPVSSTHIFPPCTRKYQDIREYFQSLATKHSCVLFQSPSNFMECNSMWCRNVEKNRKIVLVFLHTEPRLFCSS